MPPSKTKAAPKKAGNKTGVRKLFAYSPRKVKSALSAIRNGMPVLKASCTYGVPRTTLRHKLSGEAPESSGHVGPQPSLGTDTEKALVQWITENAKFGFPINKIGLLDSVQQLVKGENVQTKFVDGRPGRKWFDAFRKRNPEIKYKHAEYLNKARAEVSEDKIRNWFAEVKLLIKDNVSILEEPERVFNTDETAFTLTPKGDLVLVPRGDSVYYGVSVNSDKTNITTLITVNAVGQIAPPLTLYKYQRIPQHIASAAPDGWGIGCTDSGWMTGEAFYGYVSNVFLPWLKEMKIKFPVIIFLDGHRSHLTIHLSRFCRENEIIIVALHPNATHIIQPLDVAVFRSMKSRWKSLVRQWRNDHDGEEINKRNVTVGLDKLIRDPCMTAAIRSGFKACGIYPFTPDAIDYRKCVQKTRERQAVAVQEPLVEQLNHLQYLETKIDPELLEAFQDASAKNMDWEGDITAGMLFDTWKQFVEDSKALQHAKASCAAQIINPTIQTPMDQVQEPQLLQTPPTMPNRLTTAFSPQTSSSLHASPSPGMSRLSLGTEIAVLHSRATPEVTPTCSSPTVESREILLTPPSAKRLSEVFKTLVKWPEEKTPLTTGKRKTEYIPSVITSNQWVEYYEAKENEKLQKEKEKEEKTKQREEKKKQLKAKPKQTPIRSRPEAKPKKSTRPNKLDVDLSDSSVSSVSMSLHSDTDEDSLTDGLDVGDHVIVQYEGEFFPGVVLKIKDQVKVSVMVMSGPSGWRWPEKEDTLWYLREDIVETIRPPVTTNARGVCIVPEISKYRK